jgi:hypothetical protein
MFLRNVGVYLQVQYPDDQNLHIHRRENLICHILKILSLPRHVLLQWLFIMKLVFLSLKSSLAMTTWHEHAQSIKENFTFNKKLLLLLLLILFGSCRSSSPYSVLQRLFCSISALQLKTVLLLDAHQLLMLSAGTLMHLKQILFPLVIFYNKCGTIHILDINYIRYKFIYIFVPFLTSSTQHWRMCYHLNYINSLI